MEAKKIVLIATGKGKAEAIKKSLEGPVSSQCPGSFLR
jgi:glucosamine-6-phosphate deaminase